MISSQSTNALQRTTLYFEDIAENQQILAPNQYAKTINYVSL
jgi:hypothetical protein